MPKKVLGNLKKLAASSGRGPIQGIGEEGRQVRFLTEPSEWWAFNEVFNGEHYMVVDDDFEPDEDQRVQLRFLAAALDVIADKPIALKLPKSVAEELNKHFERRGTLLDRDYELSREGTGFDTEYFVMADDKKTRRIAKYDVPDLEAILLKEIAGDDEEEEKPKRSKSTVANKTRKVSGGSTRTAKRSTPTNKPTTKPKTTKPAIRVRRSK